MNGPPRSRGAPKTIARLRERLMTGRPSSKSAAYQLALRVFDKNDLDAENVLLEGLTAENGAVNRASIYGLGLLGRGARGAVPFLLPFISNADRETLLVVLRSLYQIGPTAIDAVPDLTPLREHQDDEIQAYAMTALARVTGDESYQSLIRKRRGTMHEYAFDDPVYSEGWTITLRP